MTIRFVEGNRNLQLVNANDLEAIVKLAYNASRDRVSKGDISETMTKMSTFGLDYRRVYFYWSKEYSREMPIGKWFNLSARFDVYLDVKHGEIRIRKFLGKRGRPKKESENVSNV